MQKALEPEDRVITVGVGRKPLPFAASGKDAEARRLLFESLHHNPRREPRSWTIFFTPIGHNPLNNNDLKK
jgi:hypothetical protein